VERSTVIFAGSVNSRVEGLRGKHMNEQDLIQRLERIEAALNTIITQRRIKDYYSTTEVATALGKAEFTVREWCRLGRVIATKRQCGRGHSSEWMISHEELLRIQNEGLLPLPGQGLGRRPRRL
jgi:hypothetical protein